MRILKSIYDEILTNTPVLPPETGGIIGGRDGIVTSVYFDKGELSNSAPSVYSPNIMLINKVIYNWSESGISFYGIFHSHYSRDRKLSSGDKKYIMEIMRAMPVTVGQLYFPIVLPKQTILGYQASRTDSTVHIACDMIEILQNREALYHDKRIPRKHQNRNP